MIIAELINGDDVDTTGVDLEVKYTFENNLGNWSVGGNLNHIIAVSYTHLTLPTILLV